MMESPKLWYWFCIEMVAPRDFIAYSLPESFNFPWYKCSGGLIPTSQIHSGILFGTSDDRELILSP
jgi:hypothetical protein